MPAKRVTLIERRTRNRLPPGRLEQWLQEEGFDLDIPYVEEYDVRSNYCVFIQETEDAP